MIIFPGICVFYKIEVDRNYCKGKIAFHLSQQVAPSDDRSITKGMHWLLGLICSRLQI